MRPSSRLHKHAEFRLSLPRIVDGCPLVGQSSSTTWQSRGRCFSPPRGRRAGVARNVQRRIRQRPTIPRTIKFKAARKLHHFFLISAPRGGRQDACRRGWHLATRTSTSMTKTRPAHSTERNLWCRRPYLLSLCFGPHHPVGMADNSPVLQRWDHAQRVPSPEGTAENECPSSPPNASNS